MRPLNFGGTLPEGRKKRREKGRKEERKEASKEAKKKKQGRKARKEARKTVAAAADVQPVELPGANEDFEPQKKVFVNVRHDHSL